MNDQFNLEEQYQFFLKAIGLKDLNAMQDYILRQTFMGASATMLKLLTSGINVLEEDEALKKIDSLFNQIENYHTNLIGSEFLKDYKEEFKEEFKEDCKEE